MAYLEGAVRWGGASLSRRLVRSIPYLGAVVAVATLGAAVQRKGVVGGLANTGLDAIPFVGAGKNLVEWLRGEDFIPDRKPERRRRGHRKVR